MASRSPHTLQPSARQRYTEFAAQAEVNRVEFLLYCTLRSVEEQARLFRRGRSLGIIEERASQLADVFDRQDLAQILIDVGPQYGQMVTNAAPGQSIHNYGMAFDIVPVRDGSLIWSTDELEDKALWVQFGEIGEQVGLEWGGRWIGLLDYPHFQEPDVRWRELIVDETGADKLREH